MSEGLPRLKFGEGHGSQAGVDVEGQGLGMAGLAVGQSGELFAVAEQEFDLKAGGIITVERHRIEIEIGAKQDRHASGVSVDDDHHPETATQAGGVDHGGFQDEVPDRVMGRR